MATSRLSRHVGVLPAQIHHVLSKDTMDSICLSNCAPGMRLWHRKGIA